jgi:hypothetical protein
VKAASKPRAAWRTVDDVPEGEFCILQGGATVRIVAQLGVGALYRDERGDGPFSIDSNTMLAGVP